MMQDADRHGDVGRSQLVVGEIADIVANELTAAAVRPLGPLDIGFVAVEADISRRLGQAPQQGARPAANSEHALAAAGANDVVGEALEPPSRTDQMMEGL